MVRKLLFPKGAGNVSLIIETRWMVEHDFILSLALHAYVGQAASSTTFFSFTFQKSFPIMISIFSAPHYFNRIVGNFGNAEIELLFKSKPATVVDYLYWLHIDHTKTV